VIEIGVEWVNSLTKSNGSILSKEIVKILANGLISSLDDLLALESSLLWSTSSEIGGNGRSGGAI